jgi:uncharacterized protein
MVLIMSKTIPHAIVGTGMAVVALLAASCSRGGGSREEDVHAWRARHEQSYRDQYVVLGGLFFLEPGVNTAGSAPSNDIVLPARVPASVGRFILSEGAVRFEPADGAGATLDGRAVTEPVQLQDDYADVDELVVGDLALWIHRSGERRAVRLRDPESEAATSFAGFTWFPVDPSYRVVGRFIPDAQPTTVRIPNLSGDLDEFSTEGVVEFTLNGETRRLRPMTTEPNRFFFIFRDGTSGRETYGAARFLYSDLEPDGTTVLEFNEAYNPPCAFNPFTTCPIPPLENRLDIRIPAGEMAYAGSLP